MAALVAASGFFDDGFDAVEYLAIEEVTLPFLQYLKGLHVISMDCYYRHMLEICDDFRCVFLRMLWSHRNKTYMYGRLRF